MIARKHHPGGTIPRKRGPKGRHSAMFGKGKGKEKDKRINAAGRPVGAVNKLPRDVKEALVQSAELHGEGSGRNPPEFDENGNALIVKAGKPGKNQTLVDYWSWVLQNRPELHIQAMIKILPAAKVEVSGPEGGPIQVMSVPQEVISKMTDEQLAVFTDVIGIVNGDAIAGPGEEMAGDASTYAKEIGLLPPPK